MSAQLSPSSQLVFNRPLTRNQTRTLSVTNPHQVPLAFKVKTTAPKVYCVRPNSGRIEPGETVDVAVILQAMREEPPLNVKCKDKFLVQTTAINGPREHKPLTDLWAPTEEDGEDARVHQHKIKVVYAPPEGQSIPEDTSPYDQPSILTDTETSRYETVRQTPSTSHTVPINIEPTTPEPEPVHQPSSPSPPFERAATPGDYTIAQEETVITEQQEELLHDNQPPPTRIPAVSGAGAIPLARTPSPAPQAHTPAQPPSPAPVFAAPASTTTHDDELSAKYAEALAEISRLQSLLAATAQAASAPVGVRRRTTRLVSEDGTSVVNGEEEEAYSDDGTAVDTIIAQPEGVPLQVVVGIAFAVFLATYLFF